MNNAELKARHPRIDNAMEAINFALTLCGTDVRDFLDTWRDGAWTEIEEAYPEFLERVRTAQVIPMPSRLPPVERPQYPGGIDDIPFDQ